MVVAALVTVISACGGAVGRSLPPAHPSSTAPPPPAPPALPLRRAPIPVAGHEPQDGHPWFLAVGDSVAAGYTVDPARSGVNSAWPLQLESLLAASGRRWSLYDLACPGETTASYRSTCPEHLFIPALTGSSQRDAALDAIRRHRHDLRLVLVGIGSNDLLQAAIAGADPATAVSQIAGRLDSIVGELREAVGATPIVVANYYDPLENTVPETVAGVRMANAALARVAAAHGAAVADFFAAINTPAPPDPALCAYVDCAHNDLHPTVAGHRRLAEAAAAVIR